MSYGLISGSVPLDRCNQWRKNLNKRPPKNRSDLAIALLVSFSAGIIIGHYQIPGFLASLVHTQSEQQKNIQPKKATLAQSTMTTYYQWFDLNGKMRISRYKPREVADYIVFEGSQNLRNVSYDIDQEMLAKGIAYRNKLLSGDDYQTETDSFLAKLLSRQNTALLDTDEQCAGLTGWLSDISRTVGQDQAMKKPFCEKYQARLHELQQIGCRATLQSFERLVCG